MERSRAERRANTEKIIKKQAKIQSRSGIIVEANHKFAKHHAMDCGTPDCFLCGNRRQHEGATIQEQSFIQTENWIEP